MCFSICLQQLSQIIGTNTLKINNYEPTIRVTGISTDTRHLVPGELFLALEGENFDGHNFAETAIAKGAIALITAKKLSLSTDIPQFIVNNTLKTYQEIAHWWREQLNIPIIGITGSVGKTTTKELITGVLSSHGQVLKTIANYNNEIGVPKTLLSLRKDHDYAVIEMAMRGRGEIALLTEITCPTIGMITNVGTAHIGRLGSEKAIAEAKCELLAAMPPDSTAVLNYDDSRLMATFPRFWQGKTVTYGLTGGDVQGEIIDAQTIRVAGLNLPLPLAGRHNALNYLGAIAVAQVLGIKLDSLTRGIFVNMPQGRSQQYQLANDIVILDETYNAGAESMIAALNLLKQTPGKRHLAILGTMKELGEYATQLHYQVGQKVKELNLDYLIVLADDGIAKNIADGAADIPRECFTTHVQVVNRLKELVQPGDRLLFKASHSVGLDRVVAAVQQLDRKF